MANNTNVALPYMASTINKNDNTCLLYEEYNASRTNYFIYLLTLKKIMYSLNVLNILR